MLSQAFAPLNRLVLDHIGRTWVDYVVSNTMTDFNRWLNGFLWTYDCRAQVMRVIDEAPGVKTFVLRPNQHWRGMRPGQFVPVTLSIDGQRVQRHYSPTLLPKGRLAITVKAVPGGRASNWMHAHLRPGMAIGLGDPQGQFCHSGQRRILVLSAGSGLTPGHAMVDSLLAQPADQRPDIQVIAQFRRAVDVIYKADLRTRWPLQGVKVHVALSGRDGEPAAPGSGRLDAQALRECCPDIAERDIFLCGPDGFMQAMLGHLGALGVDVRRVHTERFVAACQGQQPPAHALTPAELDGAEVVFRHLGASLTLTPADHGRSLLQLAQAHGVGVESGCEQGMCGTCRLHLHEGEVSGNALGQVVYLCTAYPAARRVVLDA
jgi:ferredoxin-NADP reductase